MGFLGGVADRVRDYFKRDKEQTAIQFAKGSTGSGGQTAGYDMMSAYGYDIISDYLKLEHDLMAKFVDYEEMDNYPLCCTALDIFADDATQIDIDNKSALWVTSQDQTVQQLLTDLFHRTLRIDEDIWEIARTLSKYGNDYSEILVGDDGVKGLNYLPPPTIRRIEGPRGELYGFVQDFRGKFGYGPAEYMQLLANRTQQSSTPFNNQPGYGPNDRVAALEDWEVVHIRLRGRKRRAVYGDSILESARWIFKRLVLLEDTALIYRLQRAPERYAFYVDVGDLPPREALAFLNRVRQQHKKKSYIDASTGKINLKMDVINPSEDFFVPVRNGQQGTKIEVLGSPSWQSMEDITYFLDQMFAAIKIPRAYLAQPESDARQSLSSKDVRFCRSILRIQREIRNGMAKVARIHLSALNIDPHSVEYGIHCTVPSSIFELAQMEVRTARADLAGRMQAFVSEYWVMSKILNLTDEEIEIIMQQKTQDADRLGVNQGTTQAQLTRIQGQAQVEIQNMMQQSQMAMQSQMQMAQAGVPPDVAQQAQGEPPPPPNGGKAESLGMPSYIPKLYFTNTTPKPLYEMERKLMLGSRADEARADKKIDQLLVSDRDQVKRLRELQHLLKDLSFAARKQSS